MAGETGQDSTLALALAATTALTTGVVDAPRPAAPAAAAPAPEPAPAAAPAPVVEDVDDIELRDAQAAAKAEEASAATPAQPANTAQPAPAPAATSPDKPKDQQEQQPAASGVMIPKARLDEVLGKNDELVRQNAFLAGQLEAHKAAGTKPASAAQPTQAAAAQPTAADRLVDLQNQAKALAKKFDAGDISYTDLETQRQQLANQEQAIREEMILAKVQSAQPQAQPTAQSDLYLDQLTAELETKHPYVFEVSETDFNWLTTKATEELHREGQFVAGPLGAFRLRERIAVLSDKYGELLTGKKIALPGSQPAPATQPATTQQPAPSADALARASKIAMQATMPPNVASMTGSAGEVLSEAAIENMTDDDLAALPAATRHRFLGITA